MKDSAERAVLEKCGPGLDFKVLGNAPGSFYKYKYPSWYQDKVKKEGAKVWLFKAYLLNEFLSPPTVTLGEHILDYKWATVSEMKNLIDEDTYRAVTNMYHPED